MVRGNREWQRLDLEEHFWQPRPSFAIYCLLQWKFWMWFSEWSGEGWEKPFWSILWQVFKFQNRNCQHYRWSNVSVRGKGVGNPKGDLVSLFAPKGLMIWSQSFLAWSSIKQELHQLLNQQFSCWHYWDYASVCFNSVFYISFQHLLKRKRTLLLRRSHFLLCKEWVVNMEQDDCGTWKAVFSSQLCTHSKGCWFLGLGLWCQC